MELMLEAGEKVQRINHSLQLIYREEGLRFGTDAYLLAAFVRTGQGVCADLGSGTGVIPLLLMSYGKCRQAYAFEIQPEYAALIRRNAELNGFENSIVSDCRDVRTITQKDTQGAVDYVVCNPPYMTGNSGKMNESMQKRTARHETAGTVNDFCTSAFRIVKSGGLAYFVYRPDRLPSLVCGLRDNRLEPKRMVFVQPDPYAAPSLVLVEAQSGAREGMKILPPICIYTDKDHKTHTKTYHDIYDSCQVGIMG